MEGGYGSDAFTGNTLNVWNYRGSGVTEVENFQYYNFVLPGSMQPGQVLLPVSGAVTLSNGAGTVPSTVTGLHQMGGGTPLKPGATVTLLSAGSFAGTTSTFSNAGQTLSGQHGVALHYDWLLQQTSTALTATVQSVSLNPQTKALSEGRAAGMAFVNQGADVLASSGIAAAGGSINTASGWGAFATGQVGSSRYETGSHVDVGGISIVTGLAWSHQTELGKLLLGVFFEGGLGNYDRHNSFSNAASVGGSGDTEYLGGGLLGRFDFAPLVSSCKNFG